LKKSVRTIFLMIFLGTILIFSLGLMPANASTTTTFSLRSGKQSTITINLQDKQTVAGSFNISGSGHAIDFWVRDPKGNIILDSGTVTNGENFSLFTGNVNGEYVLNFQNNGASSIGINLEYNVSSPPIFGVDPLVFIVLAISIGIILVIVGFAFYRRSRARRTNTQPPPP